MALVVSNANASATNTQGLIVNSSNTQQKAERKPVDLYLNIGRNITVQMDDGTTKEIFLSIPYGVDITNMPNRKVSGKDTEYNQMMVASNELLEMIRQKGLSLKDGESCEINLVCRLQKVSTTPSINNGGLLDGVVL